MDKPNSQQGHAYARPQFVLSSRHVPSILRRRRRSQYLLRPLQTAQVKLDSVLDKVPLQPLTQLQTQALENCNPKVSEKAVQSMSPKATSQQQLKPHFDHVKSGPVPDLRISRKRQLEVLIGGHEMKATVVDGLLSARKRQRGLREARNARPGGRLTKRELSSPAETTRRNLKLVRESNVASELPSEL